MSIELAKAYVQIVPSTEGLGNSISEALGDAGDKAGESSGKRAGSKFASALGTTAKAAGAAVAAAATAIGASVVKGVQDVAAYGDSIDKMSQKLGMSATSYQEWDAVMQHAGTSIDSMQASMKTLASAAETGNAAFETLGLSQEAIANMSQEELFASTLEALQGVEDETQRTYLAGQLLGRGATELGPLLNMTAEETQGLKDRVHEIGGVMSDEAVAAAAAYQDSLQDMQTAFSGLKNNMMAEFLPGITTVMDGLTALFSGDSGGTAMITEGVNQIATQLSEQIPTFLETGTQIVLAIFDAISENLPTLLEAGMSAVSTLLEGIVTMLPQIVSVLITFLPEFINAGISLFTALIGAMPQIISTIVAALPSIISGITDGLLANLPALIMAGVELFTSLITNLPTIIATIVAALPEIITGIVNGIVAAAPQMVEAGYNMFVGLKDGIINAAQAVWSAVTDAINGIIDGAKRLLGIASPSKVFREIGGFTMQGFAEGIIRNEGLVKDAMQEASALASGTFNSTLAISASAQPAQQQNVARELADALRNVRVYLDGNKTVGYLVPGIDNALGVRQAAAIRGAI